MADSDRDFAKLLILPVLTVLSYGTAYMFQLGHAEFFGVPSYFVDVTLTSGLVASLGVTSFAATALIYVNLPMMVGLQLMPDKSSFWYRIATIYLLLTVTSIVVLLAFGWSLPAVLFVATLLFLFTCSSFVFPLLIERYINKTGKPWAAQVKESWQRPEPPDAIELIRRLLGPRLFTFFCLCAITLAVGYAAGYYKARRTATFYGLEGTEFVCVGRYGGHLVLRKYDEKEGRFKNEFRSIASSDTISQNLTKRLIQNARFEND